MISNDAWIHFIFGLSTLNLKFILCKLVVPSVKYKYETWNLLEHMKNRVYGFHDELMMEESGCVTQI